MRIAALHFQGIYDKSGTVVSTRANEEIAQRKIALAEGMVDAYDGTFLDRNRKDDAITLFDESTHDVVQVKTQKDGSRFYRIDQNHLNRGLLWSKRQTVREVIEVSTSGEVKVTVKTGESTLGGYLTGPLIDEKLPVFEQEQTFLFSGA